MMIMMMMMMMMIIIIIIVIITCNYNVSTIMNNKIIVNSNGLHSMI